MILDEIGRGTSTYDGLSIAWAVVEHLCRKDHHIRTLFASHYHELTVLDGMISGLKNYNVSVSENDGNVVFLHRIVPGSASRSYGIHVARIAGVPAAVLERAQEKLNQLETGSTENTGVVSSSISADEHTGTAAGDGSMSSGTSGRGSIRADHAAEEQLSFITFSEHPAVEMLRKLDIMSLTPSGAIAVIEQLKKAVEDM